MNTILAAGEWNGPVSEPTAYGEGHINQTYVVTEQTTQKRYILQKINTDTFKDPDGLMEHICGVTDFLREKAKQRGADPERATLHVALTKAGKPYYKAADGGCWRVYDFVENTVCLQQVQSAEIFTKARLLLVISNTSLPTTRQIPCTRRFLTSMIHQNASRTSSVLWLRTAWDAPHRCNAKLSLSAPVKRIIMLSWTS